MTKWVIATTSDRNEDSAVFDFHGIGGKVDANRRPLGLPRLVVETAVVLGTFDDLVHDKAISQMDLLVGAEPICCEKLIVRTAIDRKGPALMIEPHDIFLVDVLDGTDFDPISAHLVLP